MVPFYRKAAMLAVCCIGLAAVAGCVQALPLLAPTPNQVVRENVRITVPEKSLPEGFILSNNETAPDKGRPFVSVSLKQGTGEEQFVDALSADSCLEKNGNINFYWNSKASYRDRNSPGEEKFFKDGSYTLSIAVHDKDGKVTDSVTVPVQLRNKIARPNPAPAVKLYYRLGFGQVSTFGLHADAQVFEMVNNVPLPRLGGLGITNDYKVIQSVEDVRSDSQALLRYRVGKGATVNSFGLKTYMYETDAEVPQLYRLVTSRGKVVKANVFSRQGKNTITDILPMLPSQSVREGDSWPSWITLKLEGVTGLMAFSGTSMFDSFEWQDGQKCAKIISRMTGKPSISLAGGRIRSQGANVSASMTTYISPSTGRLARNEITLDFPALILPGAADIGNPNSLTQPSTPPNTNPMGDMMDEESVFQPGVQPRPNPNNTVGAMPAGAKKGSVQIKIVVRREK